MAIAILMEWPGVTKEQYDEVIKSTNPGGKSAPGSQYHVAGFDGDPFRVVDVWESEDAANKFFSALAPAFQNAGFAQPAVRKVWPVYNTFNALSCNALS